MNKQEFLNNLKIKLLGLPKEEVEERLNFYSEMIEDRIEDGLSEEDAILDIGSIDEITAQIISEIPIMKIAKERITPNRKLKVWEIILFIICSPLLLGLSISLFIVVLSLYIVLWAIVVAIWAIFVSLGVSGIASIPIGVYFTSIGYLSSGLFVIGGGVICIGLAIFMYFGCFAITKATIILSKKLSLGIKKCFIKKENYNE